MNREGRLFAVGMIVALLLIGRDASTVSAQTPEKPQPPPAGHGQPSGAGAKAEAARMDGDKLILTGLTFTVPAGWKEQTVETSGPMAPKAVLRIQNEGGDPGTIRITHYPEMKGKDDMNIDRWLGQVAQADGKPSTREQAKIESIELGEVKLTVVDLSGSVKLTMRDQPHPGYRMIAAIINHPQGPHFVVAAGPAELMAKSKDQVIGFLKSAKVK